MDLKSQIENAKDAVSKALITALQDKDEYAISSLFTCYNSLNNLKTKQSYKIDFGSGKVYTNQYESSTILGGGTGSSDVISFTGLG